MAKETMRGRHGARTFSCGHRVRAREQLNGNVPSVIAVAAAVTVMTMLRQCSQRWKLVRRSFGYQFQPRFARTVVIPLITPLAGLPVTRFRRYVVVLLLWVLVVPLRSCLRARQFVVFVACAFESYDGKWVPFATTALRRGSNWRTVC